MQQARVKPSQVPRFPGPLPRFPGALPLVWMAPYPRNPLFTGREEVLAQLHSVLASGRSAALTQAITGLGGIGKTQTAMEYAYRYHQEYQVVLWMGADSEQSIVSSLLAMASELHLPEREAKETEQIVAAVKQWWHTHTGWLLVVDNADELEWLHGMLPQKGQVVLTTRSSVTRGVAEAIALAELPEEEAMLLLLRSAKLILSQSQGEMVSEADRFSASQITQDLGRLPLALDQAGAYIEGLCCKEKADLVLLCQSSFATDFVEEVDFFFSSEGYNRLSLTRASAVVKRQLTVASSSLRRCCQAWTSRSSSSCVPMRRERHWRASAESSISAIFHQLPWTGV